MAKGNPLQEQLLKAGLVKKSKLAEVAREQHKARHRKGAPAPSEIQRDAERARAEKVERDRALEAERRYTADGQLAPRGTPGAVIDTLDAALAQVRGLLRNGEVDALDGPRVPLHADTLCLHGDRPDAARFAAALRATLEAEGFTIAPPGALA